jgi:hypothetical protein
MNMDPRTPELHQAVVEYMLRRVGTYARVADILNVPTDRLSAADILKAIELIEPDLPSPLRATMFDLGRVLSGTLPTDDIAVPPPHLKIYAPEG